jgi:hypothetical protein
MISYAKQNGIIIFLDILGIKGIWRRRNPFKVIQKWQYLVRIYNNLSKDMLSAYSQSEIEKREMIIFSDTIIITIPKIPTNNVLWGIASMLTSLFVHSSNDRLFIRGGLSSGVYYHSENMIIGPAIDEVYEYHKQIEWAGISTAPSLTKIIKQQEKRGKSEHGYCPYDIPTKKGAERDGRALFWPPFDIVTSENRTIESIIKTELKKNIEENAKNKLENTLRFIQYIKGKYKIQNLVLS